jgi:acyl carrier protein
MTIEERARNVITENLGVIDEEVTPDAHFADDLGCDSLDRVELTMALEEEFGIAIPDEDIFPIETVGQIHEYLRKHPGMKQAPAESVQ